MCSLHPIMARLASPYPRSDAGRTDTHHGTPFGFESGPTSSSTGRNTEDCGSKAVALTHHGPAQLSVASARRRNCTRSWPLAAMRRLATATTTTPPVGRLTSSAGWPARMVDVALARGGSCDAVMPTFGTGQVRCGAIVFIEGLELIEQQTEDSPRERRLCLLGSRLHQLMPRCGGLWLSISIATKRARRARRPRCARACILKKLAPDTAMALRGVIRALLSSRVLSSRGLSSRGLTSSRRSSSPLGAEGQHILRSTRTEYGRPINRRTVGDEVVDLSRTSSISSECRCNRRGCS